MRRLCNQLGSQFPPISAEDFQTNFDAWKTITCDTVPIDSNPTQSPSTSLDDDFSPVELLPAPVNRTLDTTGNVTNEKISILNIAHTNFSDFDTQMSPLIYSDSDTEDAAHKNDSADIENSPSINSQQFTPDIVCNQEHAAKAAYNITKAIAVQKNSNRQITPVKRALRTLHDKISPSKRLNYKQLPIEIRSRSCSRSLSKTYLFRTKKQNKTANSTEMGKCESQSMNKMSQSNRSRSISSTSDVQIVSQTGENLSPIVISTSSEDIPQASQEPNNQNKSKSVQEVSCPSPDLFTSFSSMKSDTLSQQQQQQQSQPSPQQSQSLQQIVSSQDETNKSPLRDVFGAPDECDDIDLLSNTNVDIFEITKNSVFDNVLCSANDRITPFKTGEPNNLSPNVSCLSGLRIMLAKSNSSDAELFESSTISTKTPQPSQNSTDDVLVDLTAIESQKIIEISSEDSLRDVQKTPERKQELTPSTRSCLKRQTPAVDNGERKCKTPRSKSGWISAVKTSPKTDTPKSRRRLDKWKERTDADINMQADILRTTRPRNLCAEFRTSTSSRTDRLTTPAMPTVRTRNHRTLPQPSTSTAKSPPIFSDNE